MSTSTPVIILNGFLGSGKTTLFRNLLNQSRKKNIHLCAIVNDMSDLDVDGELLGTTETVEENNEKLESIHSCVLSSTEGIKKLDKAVKKLVKNQNPELIIIETSGSCHPMPLIEYFKNQDLVQLNGIFALVDSLMLSHDYNFGEELIPQMQKNLATGVRDTLNLLVEQIMFCSHLMLTKADRVGEENIPHIASFVEKLNPFASIHSLVHGKLELESIFELEEYSYYTVEQLMQELKPVLDIENKTDQPYDLTSRVIKDDRPFHPQRLWDACHQHLDSKVYRSKGFFWLASRDKYSLLWNQSAGDISLEIIGSWRSGIAEDENHGISEMEIKALKEMLKKETGRFGDRHCDLTVIGDKIQVDRFSDALETCFLTEEEIEAYNEGFIFEDPWPKNIVRLK